MNSSLEYPPPPLPPQPGLNPLNLLPFSSTAEQRGLTSTQTMSEVLPDENHALKEAIGIKQRKPSLYTNGGLELRAAIYNPLSLSQNRKVIIYSHLTLYRLDEVRVMRTKYLISLKLLL